jgi:hypothetical protein
MVDAVEKLLFRCIVAVEQSLCHEYKQSIYTEVYMRQEQVMVYYGSVQQQSYHTSLKR